jgi:hypothetical protein
MEDAPQSLTPPSADSPRPTLPTYPYAKLGALHLRKSRRIQAALILLAVPLVLAIWVILSRAYDLDVILAARAAMLTALPFVLLAIFMPLLLHYPKEVRWRGYIVQWFVIALFFNVIWQAPPLLIRSVFEGVEQTQANLPYFIFWWGYHSSDLDYGEMTRFWVLAEISFWVISALVVVALIQLWRGREKQAYTVLGICGALQLYNVFFFISYGGIVLNFDNIATDSVLAPILYWTFNLLWGIAGGIASVLSFVCLFRIRKRESQAGVE